MMGMNIIAFCYMGNGYNINITKGNILITLFLLVNCL